MTMTDFTEAEWTKIHGTYSVAVISKDGEIIKRIEVPGNLMRAMPRNELIGEICSAINLHATRQ